MKWTKRALVITALSVGLALSIILISVRMASSHSRSEPPRPWKEAPIKAMYVGSQLVEVDKGRARVSLSYDLDNNAELDYRLADGSGVVIMSRLLSDGSLDQQDVMRLSYPVLLPSRQRVRITIEITKPFEWPSFDDPSYLDKLRDFVKQRLVNVAEFVLFDETDHQHFELPSAWEELQHASQSSY